MYNDELIHAAVDIINRRNERLELEDELYHYGRKGMKWGKNIFEQEELNKSNKTRLSQQNERDKRGQKYMPNPIEQAKQLDRYGKFIDSKFGKGTAAKVAARYAGQQVGGAIDNAVQTGKNKITNNPYVKTANYMDSKFGEGTAAKVAKNYANEKAGEAVETGKQKVQETGENLKKKAAEKKEILDTKINDLKEGARETGEKIKEGAQEAGQKIKEGASAAGEKISETGQKIKEGASEAGQKIKEGASAAGEKIKEGGQTLKDMFGFGKDEEETPKAENFDDIYLDTRNSIIEEINAANYAGDVAVLMLGGDEKQIKKAAEKIDKTINDRVDQAVKKSGLSYKDPATKEAADRLKQEITNEYINVINTQYAALLQQQQQQTWDDLRRSVPDPATQPWMYGLQ